MKAHQLVTRCGGEVFVQYTETNNNTFTYCSSEELFNTHQSNGIVAKETVRLGNDGKAIKTFPTPSKSGTGDCNYVVTKKRNLPPRQLLKEKDTTDDTANVVKIAIQTALATKGSIIELPLTIKSNEVLVIGEKNATEIEEKEPASSVAPQAQSTGTTTITKLIIPVKQLPVVQMEGTLPLGILEPAGTIYRYHHNYQVDYPSKTTTFGATGRNIATGNASGTIYRYQRHVYYPTRTTSFAQIGLVCSPAGTLKQ